MRESAIFVQMNNEERFFPLWLKYYQQHFDSCDIYVLDHNSTGEFRANLIKQSLEGEFNLINVHNNKWFDHGWMRDNYILFQRFLLQSYRVVVATEIDEFIIPDPKHKFNSLREYIKNFEEETVLCFGLEILSDPLKDPTIDVNNKILQQRSKCKVSSWYHKPAISTVPLDYIKGQHSAENLSSNVRHDQFLYLFHLHYIDYLWSFEKDQKRNIKDWNEYDLKINHGAQNKPKSIKETIDLFNSALEGAIDLPIHLRDLL